MLNLEIFKCYLENLGFECSELDGGVLDAVLTSGYGNRIRVNVGANGTGIIDKPNRTHKWYYEKSHAQWCRLVDSVIESNDRFGFTLNH